MSYWDGGSAIMQASPGGISAFRVSFVGSIDDQQNKHQTGEVVYKGEEKLWEDPRSLLPLRGYRATPFTWRRP
jgi:hypothetical protein